MLHLHYNLHVVLRFERVRVCFCQLIFRGCHIANGGNNNCNLYSMNCAKIV